MVNVHINNKYLKEKRKNTNKTGTQKNKKPDERCELNKKSTTSVL